jgi:hypothetical protein
MFLVLFFMRIGANNPGLFPVPLLLFLFDTACAGRLEDAQVVFGHDPGFIVLVGHDHRNQWPGWSVIRIYAQVMNACMILKFDRFSVYYHNSLQFAAGKSIILNYPRLKMSVMNHQFLQPVEMRDCLPECSLSFITNS